ncbi:MAG: hypothetical protein R3304_09345, partial [Longimicrobiales bacterium]|nr:hypothetical protein [Longimicrobiales bacterium]
GTEGGDQPTLSPDAREVAFHRGNAIFVVPVDGGPVRDLGPGQWPTWGTDGSIYVNLGAVGSVRYPAVGGPADTVLALQDDHQNYYVWDVLPGGALTLVTTGDGTFEVWAAYLETGEMRFLVEGEDPLYVETGHLLFRFEGSLMAAPFDPRSMELRGPAVSLASDVTAQAISRDGRLLYSTGTSATTLRQLVWVDRSGSVTPVDSSWTFVQGDINTSWRLSPDGGRVALREMVDGVYDLWVKQLDEGPRSRLTFDERADYFPMWSPDGESVTFVSGSPTGLDVWTRRADGTGEPELLLDAEESIALAYWSPDREWMILRTTTGAGNVFGRDIKALRPGVDSVPQPLLVGEFDEMDPALSPDGRWLAYASNETGSFEVYVRPFPDVQAGRWQISTDGGHGPVWSRDGDEIFFRDGNSNMAAAAVDGSGPALRVASPRVLFPFPDDVVTGSLSAPFDVHPDGRRFLMARALRAESDEGATFPDFVLVQNFDQELRTRVPN